MSIEQKAKAYDEALDRMKHVVIVPKNEGALQALKETIFPELKESEDERIRKSIIHILQVGGYMPPEEKDKAFAYLEKQKELPFVKDVILGYPGLYFYDGERMHFQGNPAMEENPYDFAMSQQEKQKEQKPITTGVSFNPDDYEVVMEENATSLNQKEQKPDIEICPHSIKSKSYKENGYPVEQKPIQTENEREYVKTLKGLVSDFIRNSGGGIVDTAYYQQICNWLDGRHVEQKPAEWSEEDKAIISCIVCCLDGQFVTEAARKQCLEWFNKHRRDFLNQPKQEWSEEDEKTIDDAYCWLCEYAGSLMQKNREKSSMLYGIADKLKSLPPQSKEELAKMLQDEYNKGRAAGKREGYTKGYDKGYKDANESVSYHFPVMPTTPSGWGCNGTHCTNPQMDCINCPVKSTDRILTTASSSGDLTLKTEWKPSEEQMDRLFSIVAALRKDYCDDMADFLASLYKQLKQLI